MTPPSAPRTARVLIGLLALPLFSLLQAQNPDLRIKEIRIDAHGSVAITVPSTTQHYYVLYHRRELDGESNTDLAIRIQYGEEGTTTLRDQLGTYPDHGFYRVAEHRLNDPADTDGDGVDDVTELEDTRSLNPLNPAKEIDFNDGSVIIHDRKTFREMSYQGTDVLIDTHLEDLEFVKFQIENSHTAHPEVYFLNTETHRAHFRFMRAVNIQRDGPGQMRGEIIFHPHVTAPSGQAGVYRFEFEPNDNYAFERVQLGYELLARAMPFLRNNLMYYPMPNAALPRYHREKDLYDDSRVEIILEEDLFGDIAYLPLNLKEGYGRLRLMDLDERPTSRDIVLYRSLPNELPRVAGIITEIPQTPLSHVNLRAIQDGVPNAFIRNASDLAPIASLIGKQVYYNVTIDGYDIRLASPEEVDAHFEDLRPKETQVPVRDLSLTEILPLSEIRFQDSPAFGVKTANLATMHTFNLPAETVPQGFGIPFYFYDEFMKHNGFGADVDALLADAELREDPDALDEALDDLRDAIKDGTMPGWMRDALGTLQEQFGTGASIRCRSSTNNEDLPGFSGAGLYDSFTHHPHEGHLSKSIKQVYASLWNFRAYEERDFFRIDHRAAAMGVLVHNNFENERANGVAVTTDPFYQTEGNFYLNTQVGEDLVTNPEGDSVPEEILIDKLNGRKFTVIRSSNRVPDGEQILSDSHLETLRDMLRRIDASFRTKYQLLPWTPNFAMEVEFKITQEGTISIKQARPWVF